MTSNLMLTIFCCFLINISFAQELEITNHSYDGFHDFPTDIFFAEDADNNIWVLQVGGFTGNIISRYSDGVWESIDFDDCSNCVYNINTNNDGVVYLSSGMGFYAYENETWVSKSADVTGREAFVFDADNNLWFEHEGDPEALATLSPDGSIAFVDGISDDVSDLSFGTDGLIWFSNQQGILSTDGTVTQRYEQSSVYLSTGADNRTYFIDGFGNIGYVANEVILQNQYQSADNGFPPTYMTVDKNFNYMWLGNQGLEAGVTLLDLATGASQFINSDDLYVDVVGLTDAMFVKSDGTLWAAGRFDGQVVEINPDYVSSTNELVNKLSISPNPTSDYVTLTFKTDNEDVSKFKIYDRLGNNVQINSILSYDAQSLTLDLTSLESGVYYVQTADSIAKIVKL